MPHRVTRALESRETARITLELTHVMTLPHVHLRFPIYIYMCFCFGLPLDLSFHMSSTTCGRELSGSLLRICIVDFVI